MHILLLTFFKAYRGKGKIANVNNVRYENNEAIFTCKDCLQTLKAYMKEANSMFFWRNKKDADTLFFTFKGIQSYNDCSILVILVLFF